MLTDTANQTEIATVTANTTTYNDNGFSCSSSFYNYRVRAFRQDDGTYSDCSNVASFCPKTGLRVPTSAG